MCKKPDPTRIGEGYLVVAKKFDEEVIRQCPSCKGTGLIFIKEEEQLGIHYDNTEA